MSITCENQASSKLQSTQQPTQPITIFQNDNPTLQITTIKLDGTHFLEWFQSVKQFLKE